MTEAKETREEWLTRVVGVWEELTEKWVIEYVRDYHKLKRGSALRHITALSEDRGLKSYFIDNDLHSLKQNFYVFCKLLMASQKEAEPGGDVFATYVPFLYGLLSDSPEIHDWLAHAEIKNRDYVKDWAFRFHQFQLVLRQDDAALRATIAIVAKKGGNRDKAQAAAGEDFFSLLLKQDKAGLQTLIEGQAKIKSAQELEGQFLAGFAVIHAKLCWIRGIEVDVKNPLVPMPLLPVQPLDAYDVEYEFLRPDWIPPKPNLLETMKRWLK
jgi:hypothetical protein